MQYKKIHKISKIYIKNEEEENETNRKMSAYRKGNCDLFFHLTKFECFQVHFTYFFLFQLKM